MNYDGTFCFSSGQAGFFFWPSESLESFTAKLFAWEHCPPERFPGILLTGREGTTLQIEVVSPGEIMVEGGKDLVALFQARVPVSVEEVTRLLYSYLSDLEEELIP